MARKPPMIGQKSWGHLRHHGRFYISFLLGLLVWAVAEFLFNIHALGVVLAGDTFFLLYLVLTAFFVPGLTPAKLRKRADFDDEGIALIALITLATISVSFVAIFMLINGDGRLPTWHTVLCIASVPLGWLMLHAVMAFHYAHLFYTDERVGGKKSTECGGLEFPDTKEPGIYEFLYFSYVIGMTAQTSDTAVTMRHMRQTTLVHSIISFFYNTAILAFAVNIAASLAG